MRPTAENPSKKHLELHKILDLYAEPCSKQNVTYIGNYVSIFYTSILRMKLDVAQNLSIIYICHDFLGRWELPML